MGNCPFHNDTQQDGDGESSRELTDSEQKAKSDRQRGGVSRRDFVQSALLIGGAGALSGLSDALGITAAKRSPEERAEHAERVRTAARANRQHAWDEFESVVGTGNTAQPASSLILMLDYVAEGEPKPGHRQQVTEALQEIENHFAWEAEGVLFTIAYSAAYFDRFESDPPPGAAPWPAARVVDESSSLTPYDPDPDTADAVLLLASENPANVLAVEAALWDESGTEVPDFTATFEGVFERPRTWPARRVGEAGSEFQNTEATYEEFLSDAVEEDIPDEAPLSMGFIAGFGESIPSEDAVTLTRGQRFPGPDIDVVDVPTNKSYVGEVGERDPGMFAQGTLKHLSYLTVDLDEWYQVDRDRRRHQMYSPYHDAEETTANDEKPGDELTSGDRGSGPGTDTLVSRPSDGTDDDATVYADKVPETATADVATAEDVEASEPTTGHSQKAARARYDVDGDGEVEQPCLRRDWDGIRPAVDGHERRPGYHFNVPMRFNESIMTLLDANYGPQFTSLDGQIDHSDVDAAEQTATDGERNGIAPFLDATRRNNWLVPPIKLRALPYPRADTVEIGVELADGEYTVAVANRGHRPLDPDTIEFGTQEQVDKARGASPTAVERGPIVTLLTFDADGVADGADTLALFAKRQGNQRPVTGTYNR